MPNETFLRLPAVIRKVGFSKSRIYALIAQGDFLAQSISANVQAPD